MIVCNSFAFIHVAYKECFVAFLLILFLIFFFFLLMTMTALLRAC